MLRGLVVTILFFSAGSVMAQDIRHLFSFEMVPNVETTMDLSKVTQHHLYIDALAIESKMWQTNRCILPLTDLAEKAVATTKGQLISKLTEIRKKIPAAFIELRFKVAKDTVVESKTSLHYELLLKNGPSPEIATNIGGGSAAWLGCVSDTGVFSEKPNSPKALGDSLLEFLGWAENKIK